MEDHVSPNPKHLVFGNRGNAGKGAKSGKEQIKINALTQAKLIRLLLIGDYMLSELAEETGLHYTTVCEYCRKLRAEGALYVRRWEPDKRGARRMPVYRLGFHKDADRPPPTTSAERQRRTRERQRAAALLHKMAGPTPLEQEPHHD